jgi:hypothetical protein
MLHVEKIREEEELDTKPTPFERRKNEVTTAALSATSPN